MNKDIKKMLEEYNKQTNEKIEEKDVMEANCCGEDTTDICGTLCCLALCDVCCDMITG